MDLTIARIPDFTSLQRGERDPEDCVVADGSADALFGGIVGAKMFGAFKRLKDLMDFLNAVEESLLIQMYVSDADSHL